MNHTDLQIEGFDIYEAGHDDWMVLTKGSHIHCGTFLEVVIYAVAKLGFDIDEIDFAIQQMIKHDHNAAHFGMGRGFIFTFRKDFNDVTRIAS